jgi:hypothetical protein
MTCLIVSVDITVDIPRRLPNREDSVLFPVPEVPAKRTRIFLFDSIDMLIKDALTDEVRSYIEIFQVFRLRIFILIN